jgi:DNA polymerase-3 subunit delta
MATKAQKGKIRTDAPVYLVCGSDEYMVGARARKIADMLSPAETQTLGLEIIDGRVKTTADAMLALRQARDAVRTGSLLGGDKVVWLRDAVFFGGTPAARSNDVKDAVAALAALVKDGLPAGNRLLVSTTKIDKRSSFYKVCKAAGEVFEYEASGSYSAVERRAGDIASQAARKAGLSIDRAALQELVERTGPNTRQIVQEIEKLFLYTAGGRQVTVADVEAVVPPSRETMGWKLADAVARRDVAESIKVMRRLFAQRVAPIQLVYALERQFRYMEALDACARQGLVTLRRQGRRVDAEWSGSEADNVLAESGKADLKKMHPFRVAQMLSQLKAYRPGELGWCRKQILAAHEKLVSASVSPELVMEVLVTQLSAADDGGRRG